MFDWKALVDLARNLGQQAATAPNSEAYQRSAVNRAYFGAFGYAFNYAKQFLKYHPRENPDDHGRLREHLKVKKRYGAAERLRQLRELRNQADYVDDLPWEDFQATVESAIKLAGQVFLHLPPPTSAGNGHAS
jgi:hypothetical protein